MQTSKGLQLTGGSVCSGRSGRALGRGRLVRLAIAQPGAQSGTAIGLIAPVYAWLALACVCRRRSWV